MSARLLRRLPVVLAIAALMFGWIGLNLEGIYFRDAMAYWRPDLDDLYGGRHVGIMSTYLYSPAFAQLVTPLGLLPWEAFALLFSAINLLALAWMVGPIVAAILFWVPGPVADEISTGNIHLLLAAAAVIAFRYSSAWAFPVLTKITPGVGAMWMAGARQWRSLLVAVLTTAAIVAVSFALAPGAWFEWVDTLQRSTGIAAGEAAVIPGPLWLRTATAAVLAVWAGMAGWRWLVPAAMTIALPVPWSSGLSLLVGSLALSRDWWEDGFRRAWARVTARG